MSSVEARVSKVSMGSVVFVHRQSAVSSVDESMEIDVGVEDIYPSINTANIEDNGSSGSSDEFEIDVETVSNASTDYTYKLQNEDTDTDFAGFPPTVHQGTEYHKIEKLIAKIKKTVEPKPVLIPRPAPRATRKDRCEHCNKRFYLQRKIQPILWHYCHQNWGWVCPKC